MRAVSSEIKPVKGVRKFDTAVPRRTLAAVPALPEAYLGHVIRRVELPKGIKLVALTFDLCEFAGEIAGYDGFILDYLRANNVKATVFAAGKWLMSHAERGRQLVADPLIEVANHGWAHRNTRLLGDKELEREIVAPQLAYESLREDLAGRQCVAELGTASQSIPSRMSLFRFPFGACNSEALARVHRHGLLAIQWDISTGDADPGQSAQAIAHRIVQSIRPGSIVLMHANGRGYHTARALPLAIPKLRAMGYRFVTVSELLAAGKPVLASMCYDARPGDIDRYDRLLPAARAPRGGSVGQQPTISR